MGIGSKIIGALKETWDGILSPGPVEQPKTFHRAGFGPLYNILTGNNIPPATENKTSEPALKQ